MNPQGEFSQWLNKCAEDAEEKLNLSNLEIAMQLLEKAQSLILEEIIRKKKS